MKTLYFNDNFLKTKITFKKINLLSVGQIYLFNELPSDDLWPILTVKWVQNIFVSTFTT